jgi:antitoxin FitA
MAEVTVGLSDDARAEFAARAARCGLSLEEYLTDELEYLALKPTPDDWLARVRTQTRRLVADIDPDRRKRRPNY